MDFNISYKHNDLIGVLNIFCNVCKTKKSLFFNIGETSVYINSPIKPNCLGPANGWYYSNYKQKYNFECNIICKCSKILIDDVLMESLFSLLRLGGFLSIRDALLLQGWVEKED